MFKRVHRDLGTGWTSRSFKREVALVAFVVWVVLTYKVFWSIDVTVINALNAPYGTASMSIWLYIMAAFGLDSVTRSMMGNPAAPSGYQPAQIPPATKVVAKPAVGQPATLRVMAVVKPTPLPPVPPPPAPGSFE